MSIVATFAKPLTRLMAIAKLGFTANKTSPDTYGPAINAMPWLKPDGASLIKEREQWAFRAMQARNLRQNKQASICEDRCRAATHAILQRGPDAD
jgi:hypothetical protein